MYRTLAALLALTVIAVLAAAGSAQARAVAHQTYESPSQVRAYWTLERMRTAIPRDRTNHAGAPAGSAKPAAGKARPGGTSPSTSVLVDTSDPAVSAHGKVFFQDSGVNYVCSGTALVGNVVWTAGHCVNEGPGGFYSNFMFVPAYSDGQAPHGRFAATELKTTSGWQTSGEYGVDLGAAVPSLNEFEQTLTEVVSERKIVFRSARNQSYAVYGYPAAKSFNGQRLRVCNTAWSRDDASATPATMGVPCDMTGGSSGGGWVTGGAVASVVSYGYGSLKNVLFGPYLDSEAETLYEAAK